MFRINQNLVARLSAEPLHKFTTNGANDKIQYRKVFVGRWRVFTQL